MKEVNVMLQCLSILRIRPFRTEWKRFEHTARQKLIRNVGMLAHVDAGKTTTTERMLFYSGKTNSLGEVHHGNTVTDCLTQERDRGITVCSSAVSFSWKNYRINLLDTPGHIDFTMEVEQSLFAVDGVIVVLDGTTGVEAQTVTVWSQAERHLLPKIIFVNKIDRHDANYAACLKDLKEKLKTRPLPLYLPTKLERELLSIIDVIRLKKICWKKETLGKEFEMLDLNEHDLKSICEQRNELIDTLCEYDDSLAESVMCENGYKHVTEEMIHSAIRKATCSRNIVPVIVGSAYKNVGMQVLLDAVCAYLPSPSDRNDLFNCFDDNFVGKVFKVIHDKQRGPLSLVRVMRGAMQKGMRLSNMRGVSDVLQRIYEPLADNYREIDKVESGDIAVCAGLKNSISGDLLISNLTVMKNAQNSLKNTLDADNIFNATDKSNGLIDEALLLKRNIPDPVYFCSIEPSSLTFQNELKVALNQLQREDPSLRVQYNDVTGQTILGGMGELHIEIVKSRLKSEYKIDAELGPLQIAYNETIKNEGSETWSLQKEIAGSKQHVSITMKVEKSSGNKEIFRLDKSPDNMAKLKLIRPRTLQIIKKGALAGLLRGPRVGGKVIEAQIMLKSVNITRGTADSFLMAAALNCIQKILSKVGTRLLEPIMLVQIIAPPEMIPAIQRDLGKRRASIKNIYPLGELTKLIECSVPLAEMTGYSNILRKISSGNARMTMQPCGHAPMNPQEEAVAERRTIGLE